MKKKKLLIIIGGLVVILIIVANVLTSGKKSISLRIHPAAKPR